VFDLDNCTVALQHQHQRCVHKQQQQLHPRSSAEVNVSGSAACSNSSLLSFSFVSNFSDLHARSALGILQAATARTQCQRQRCMYIWSSLIVIICEMSHLRLRHHPNFIQQHTRVSTSA
jgi:hypothetical protein